MTTLISGTLIDGTGQPVHNGQIFLTALKTSATVMKTVVAMIEPADSGQYSMNVEPGVYSVMLFIDNHPPQTIGKIEVLNSSIPGTLNDFLTHPTSGDLTDDVMARFEALSAQVYSDAQDTSRLAGEANVARDDAVVAKNEASERATRAKASEEAAKASETNAAKSDANAGESVKKAQREADRAEAAASEGALSAGNAKTQAEVAESSALHAETSATHAESSAIAAASSELQAATALKEAQEIAKTPGADGPPGQDGLPGEPGKEGASAYDVWVSQQTTGSDTSMAAYMQAIKGDKGEKGEKGDPSTSMPIPTPGDVGSLVFAETQNPLRYGDTTEGSELKPAGYMGMLGGFSSQDDYSFTGTWQCLGYVTDVAKDYTLFQRIR